MVKMGKEAERSMCTVADERAVVACDVAIGQVRHAMSEALGPGEVRSTVLDGAGTLVEAAPAADSTRFAECVRAAIADAQAAQ